jgi:glycine/D-amino acid oxidase-like deaminating enzyme
VYFPYRTTRLSSSEGSLRAYPQTPSSLHRRCAGKMLPRTSRYSRKSGRPTFAKTAELQPESRRFSSDWFPTDMSSCHEEFFRETAAQRLPGLSERLASPGDTRRSASETSPDELPRRGARPFAPSRLPPRPSP